MAERGKLSEVIPKPLISWVLGIGVVLGAIKTVAEYIQTAIENRDLLFKSFMYIGISTLAFLVFALGLVLMSFGLLFFARIRRYYWIAIGATAFVLAVRDLFVFEIGFIPTGYNWISISLASVGFVTVFAAGIWFYFRINEAKALEE